MPRSFSGGTTPERNHWASLLRRLTATKSLEHGERLHAEIAREGRDGETLLGNLLVQMYTKCDRLESALLVFDRINYKNVYSWNSVLAAYARSGHLQTSRYLLERMPQRDVYSWTIVMTAHAEQGHIDHAKRILNHIPEANAVSWTALITAYAEKGDLLQAKLTFDGMPERDSTACNAMVAAYSRCWEFQKAKNIFNRMPQWDLVSWNTMLSASVEHGHLHNARRLFASMPKKDVVTWNCILQTYMENGEPEEMKYLFDEMQERSVVSWNLILQAYAHIWHHLLEETLRRIPAMDLYTYSLVLEAYILKGEVQHARRTFDELSQRDVVIWTTMVLAYAQEGHIYTARSFLENMPWWNAVSGTILIVSYSYKGDVSEAAGMFNQMHDLDVCAWNAMLSAFARNGHLEQSETLFSRMPVRNLGSWNAMMQSYVLNGRLSDAALIFSTMVEKDNISWNSMMAAYAQSGECTSTLKLFSQMDLEGVQPEPVSYATALNACAVGGTKALESGKLIHEELVQNKVPVDAVVWTSLVNLYGRSGCLTEAVELFRSAVNKDVAAWNAILTACVRNNHLQDALHLFKSMDLEGMKPDSRTYALALDVCASLAALTEGKLIHQTLIESQTYESKESQRPILETALVNLYGSCGELQLAEKIFESIPNKDTAAWNSIITQTGLKNQDAQRALDLFKRMDLEGDCPDEVTYARVLEICGSRMLQALDATQMKSEDLFLSTSLVNMYGRCGKLDEAVDVFANMNSVQDTACWNAILSAYSHNGKPEQVLSLFGSMQLYGTDPDGITFITLLSACSHSGKLEQGLICFACMRESFWMVPTVNHYVCMADLLARLGQVEKAERLVSCMPFEPMPAAWTCVLGACSSAGNLNQARHAASRALDVEPENSSLYVLLSNILLDS